MLFLLLLLLIIIIIIIGEGPWTPGPSGPFQHLRLGQTLLVSRCSTRPRTCREPSDPASEFKSLQEASNGLLNMLITL